MGTKANEFLTLNPIPVYTSQQKAMLLIKTHQGTIFKTEYQYYAYDIRKLDIFSFIPLDVINLTINLFSSLF